MLRKQLVLAPMAMVIALGGMVGMAYAGNNDNAKEMAALSSARISLTQAIAAAEQKVGGKAIDGGLNNESGVMTYAVEVASGKTVQTVLVDLNTGQITKVAPADTEPGENTEHNGQETGN